MKKLLERVKAAVSAAELIAWLAMVLLMWFAVLAAVAVVLTAYAAAVGLVVLCALSFLAR